MNSPDKQQISMFDIAFQFEGKEYKGWARPSGKKTGGDNSTSYHVVLNGVFFGIVSFNDDQWETDSQREHGLVQKVGEQIANMK